MVYPKTLNAKETKALLAKVLKESFPATKFSIKADGWNRIDISWTDGPSEKAIHSITAWFEMPCSDYENIRYEEAAPITMIKAEELEFISEFDYISATRQGNSDWSDETDSALQHASATLESFVKWDGEEEFESLQARLQEIQAQRTAEALRLCSKTGTARKARSMAL